MATAEATRRPNNGRAESSWKFIEAGATKAAAPRLAASIMYAFYPTRLTLKSTFSFLTHVELCLLQSCDELKLS